MVNYLFPEGRKLCLTFSYDDGSRVDERLANIFSEHGLKGTFNLNARGILCGERKHKILADELKPLFLDHGHEVACHGYDHPFEEKLPLPCVMEDIRQDRLALEAATGAPVRGFAYPFGTFSDDVKTLLKMMGIAYARTVKNCKGTPYMPNDFLEWDPTCHHKDNILDRVDPFLNTPAWYGTHMLYVWGHAYEFENSKNWHIIEDFCKRISGHADTVWYATNIEIADYIQAFRNLRYSMDMHQVYNPSVITVWLQDNSGKAVAAKPGELTELA